MRILRFLSLLLLPALAAPALAGPTLAAPTVAAPVVAPAGAAEEVTLPTLVGIRAVHYPGGYEHVVFTFDGGLPTVRARYVDELIADASGLPVWIAGRAIIRVRFGGVNAHDENGPTVLARKAFPLPNVMTAVRAGDFEGVVSYGLGLAKETTFGWYTLRNPDRVVIDIKAAFPTVDRKVWFFNTDRYLAATEPYFTPRLRPVREGMPIVGALDRIFAGPTLAERADGLRLLRSEATGFSHLSVVDGVARVRLEGGCDSHGSTVTIAGEIMPTLRQFPSIDWVKIYDPAGTTETPFGHTDSIPVCLEP